MTTYSSQVGPFKKSGEENTGNKSKRYYLRCPRCGLFVPSENKEEICPVCNISMNLELTGNKE